MAEVEGLVASIAQTASAGIELSTALCDFASGVGRAEQEIADISDDVKITAIALDGVARVIGQDDGIYEVSKNAVSEADGLSKRCGAVFGEVQDYIEKRSKLDQARSENSNAPELSKEQRVELLKRRLDHLKDSLMLLLHVLRLASGQARGNIENSILAQERATIRELHQRQQDSMKALQALESKLGDALFSDNVMLSGSAAPSRVPTINFLVNSSVRGVPLDRGGSVFDKSPVQAPSALANTSETSDSDDTVTDDDREHLTVNELAQCANHVRKLLKRITMLQQSCETGNPQSNQRLPRSKVLKVYRRFCRKFEAEMIVPQIVTSAPAPLPTLVSPSHRFQLVQTQEPARESQQQAQHRSRTLPDPYGAATDRTAHPLVHVQGSQNDAPTNKPVTEAHHAPTAPAWTISSEPLGPGSRPKLPPLISTVPSASQTSPANDILSPGDEQDAKHSGTDGDAEHVSQGTGPVVYTKTGRISKAKKGLKVHVCEECGRSFTRAEHLRRHQKNHGPNQVRCELCGKVFFRADLLQRHLERHKDLPQGYRFSNAPVPPTEGASPIPGDDLHHRHILPAPGHTAPGVHPHHSPNGRSVESSGAPTPSEIPAPSPVVAQRARSAWETANAESVGSHVPEASATQRPHAWQTVNARERMQESSEATHTHASSPSLQQHFHPGLPKLQPKVVQPKVAPANGAPYHKRYSNILPAPGALNAQQQYSTYPQSHIPNMLPTQYLVSPTQAVHKAPTHQITYHDTNQVDQGKLAQGPQASPMSQDERTLSRSPPVASTTPSGLPFHSVHSHHQIDIKSPTSPTFRNSPGNTPRRPPTGTLDQGHHEQPSGLIDDSRRASVEIKAGQLSSDKDGVNWRLAETDSGPYRKRKHNRTVSQADGDSSGVEDIRGHRVAHRTPDDRQRSHSGSRSLSLVTPQDERDHALLGKLPRDDRQLTEVTSPHGGPPMRALSPALVERPPVSRPSTGAADLHVPAGTGNDGPESPEPESPYSLATINRYIKNQGPQPGVNQDEEMADQGSVRPTVQISMVPCERCREYSIKCDGRLPQCTACATTKYAGECSFTSMSAHLALPVGSIAGPPTVRSYDDMTVMTRQAMAEPQQQGGAPHVTGDLHPDQGYNNDEDLPSPYLRPRDKAYQAKAMAQILSGPLDRDQGIHSGEKRKAIGEEHMDADTDGKMRGRKKSKGNHTGNTNGSGKDIVDMLLDQWSVPAH